MEHNQEHNQVRNDIRTNQQLNAQRQRQHLFKRQQQQVSEQQTLDQQAAGFAIIGQQSNSQILQVNLYPKQKIYIRGKVLYGNFDYIKDVPLNGYKTLFEWVKQLFTSGGSPFIKIHNSSDKIWYFGLSRTGGKILVIDSDAYGNDIYVKDTHIIMSNVNNQISTVKKHNSLSNFINRNKKDENQKQDRTLVVLQSSLNSIMIQKYLGPNQKFYCQENRVLAISGSIKIDKNMVNNLYPLKLEGPGWVFIDSKNFYLSKKFVFLILISFIMFFFMTLLGLQMVMGI